MHRLRGAASAFTRARQFGRGRCFSAWLAARYALTGHTGQYRIKPWEPSMYGHWYSESGSK